MTKTIESATEYYALLFTNDGESDDIDEYIDYEERVVEIAVGATYIGELTDDQLHYFKRKYQKESKIRKFEYSARFVDKSSIPPRKETELNLLFDELTIDRQKILDTLVRIANNVRNVYGCGNKNIALRGELPLVDEKQENWVSQDEFLEKREITIQSLRTYRNKGKKSEDGRSGIDSQGYRWKKEIGDKQNAKPKYCLPNDE